jgi:hypothetical protein
MSEREKKLVMLLIPAVALILIVRFGFLSDAKTAPAVTSGESVGQAEKRLEKLRLIAATAPGRQKVLAQVDADLALREKGIIQGDTAPQAQARLLEIVRKVATAEGIDVRGGDFGQPKVLSADYAEVLAVVSFNCPIEKFVNFVAGLSHEPELIGPTEIHVTSQNQKEKTVMVRMTLGGLVTKKMIPEKKGFTAF